MPKRALIVVDLQRDFLPGGALPVPHGDEVIPTVQELIRQADGNGGVLVVATQDWHPPEHRSFSAVPTFVDGSWPPHCVQETPGSELVGFAHDRLIVKGTERDVEAYSGFDGQDTHGDGGLEELLRSKKVEEVVVVGLALDYCVKATAIDARRAGFKTTVLLDATRAVDPVTGGQAVRELRAAGVIVR